MTIIEKKIEILNHWNSKKITVHKKMNPDLSSELSRTMKYYEVEEIKGFIDFYATILEPGVPESQKKYFWTYKWNLWEFLKRGIRKFDGQDVSNYLKNQTIQAPEAIIFKRK